MLWGYQCYCICIHLWEHPIQAWVVGKCVCSVPAAWLTLSYCLFHYLSSHYSRTMLTFNVFHGHLQSKTELSRPCHSSISQPFELLFWHGLYNHHVFALDQADMLWGLPSVLLHSSLGAPCLSKHGMYTLMHNAHLNVSIDTCRAKLNWVWLCHSSTSQPFEPQFWHGLSNLHAWPLIVLSRLTQYIVCEFCYAQQVM